LKLLGKIWCDMTRHSDMADASYVQSTGISCTSSKKVRRIFSLRFHLLGNAQALKEFGEIDAAGAARRWLAIGDGFRFEQRLRKSLWRGYVGLRRARFHRNGDARPGQRHIRTR
jgi:hypothetical protein